MNDKAPDADRVIAGWQETIREVETNKDGFVEIPRKRIVTTPTQAMDDKTLVERLGILIKDDHERGCQGRYYSCTCGYDNNCSQAMQDAKSYIKALEADNARLVKTNGLRMDELHKERKEAKLWFEQAQEWKARNEALEAALQDMAKAERDRIVAWLREAQVEAMKQGKLEASAAMTGFADALESKP